MLQSMNVFTSVVRKRRTLIAIVILSYAECFACDYAFNRLNPPRNSTGENLVKRSDLVIQVPVDTRELPDLLDPYRSHGMVSSGIYVELIRSFESEVLNQNNGSHWSHFPFKVSRLSRMP